MIANTHRRKTLRDRLTVGPIPVSDYVVWCFIPREGLGDLTGDPLRRWIGRVLTEYSIRAGVTREIR